MKTWIRLGSVGIIGLAVLGTVTWRIVLHPEAASLPVTAGTGSHPDLPQPNHTLFPTVNIATPVGWAQGKVPTPAQGLAVTPYAKGLDHPRWLYRLPNGDSLAAESNSPKTDVQTLKNRIAGIVMGKVGAGEAARTGSSCSVTLRGRGRRISARSSSTISIHPSAWCW